VAHQVIIDNTGEVFACGEDCNVLHAMEQLRRKGIPVGCRNGGCGVCKIEVMGGAFAKRKMSRAVVSAEEEARGCVLACKTYPQGDLRVRVVGKMAGAVERALKPNVSSSIGFCWTISSPPPDKET